jgi:hypothetical protein
MLGVAIAALVLWTGGRDSVALAVLGSVLLAGSLFWYTIPGHALIYGPHLFVFGLVALAGDLVRWVSRRWR